MRKNLNIVVITFILLCTALPCSSYAAVIAVNAGHQAKANLEKEALGPGSEILKYKVSGGTRGVVTNVPEYELNLQIAKLLEQKLQERGHTVVMIRESNDVNISNKERVEKAVENSCELIISLHANAPGAGQPKDMQGIMTLCRSRNNQFNATLYPSERKLAEAVQASLCAATGAVNLGVIETDRMSGINWSPVPSVIIEVGYMTNAEEDLKLQQDEYRQKIVTAVADGIEEFLKE